MKAVVDTNVIAYYLLGTAEFETEVRQFWESVRDPLAPAILGSGDRQRRLDVGHAGALPDTGGPAKLHLARRLGIHTIATRALWHGALLRSVQTGVAVYDTLFVELAEREQAPLVTFDQRLLRSPPAIACRPAELGAR